MSRAVLILTNTTRAKAVQWIASAPDKTRVEFKAPRRSLPQNDRMWAMLTDFAAQADHHGNRYTTDDWKVIFLHALGKEARFVPALDGHGFIPIGQSSSDLSVAEMSDLIELIHAEGARRGIHFNDPETARLEAARRAA